MSIILDNSFDIQNDDSGVIENEEIRNTIEYESDKEPSTSINSNDFIKKKRKKLNLEENDIYINSNEIKYVVPNFIQGKKEKQITIKYKKSNKCLNTIDVNNSLTSVIKSILNEQIFEENTINCWKVLIVFPIKLLLETIISNN